MKYFFPIITLLALSCGTIHGKVGETYIQTVKRYGKPVGEFKDQYAQAALFQFKAFTIFVRYRNNVSFEEIYLKLNKTGQKEFAKAKDSLEMLILYILTEPRRLLPLESAERDALRSANYRGMWKKRKSTHEVEAMELVKGNIRIYGNYAFPNKALVITDMNSLAPKTLLKEMIQIRSQCLPLGSSFKDYYKKYGAPYYWNSSSCYFVHDSWAINVEFNTPSITKGKVYHDKQVAMKNNVYHEIFKNLSSQNVTYCSFINNIWTKHKDDFMLCKKNNEILMQQKKLSPQDQKTYDVLSTKLYYLSSPYNLDSLRRGIIKVILKGTVNTEWNRLEPNIIGYITFFTWDKGRRIWGSYDIITKKLNIYYGTGKNDYNQEEIKKIKAKKSAEEILKTF